MPSIDRRVTSAGLLLGLLLAGCARSGGPSEAADPTPFAAEYPTYETVAEMQHDTEAVVVAETVGDASPRPLPNGRTADYFQRIRVLDVLEGTAPARDTIVSIVRLGLSGPSPRGGAPGHVVYGPLDPGKHVLFLRRAADAGAWSIVGHVQGDLLLVGGRTGYSTLVQLRGQTPGQIRMLLSAR